MTASPPSLRLVTLGAAELVAVAGDDRSLLFGPGKPVALLAYLAASPGRSARREHLLDLLWADVEPEAGRHALRQLVWYVRQRAGDLLEGTRDTVRLRAALPSDRQDFLDAVERQDSDAAVRLYAGAFLPNVALPGGGEFEQWADLEGQRLRSLFLRCGDTTARRLLSTGAAREAIGLARRMLETDPHSEHLRRLLLEALLSANDRLGATAEADALTQFLYKEGREPEPATRALLRRVSSAPESDARQQSIAIATETIGRAEEFRKLVEAWEEARAGVFRHIHLVAGAGIGKSRLLADFAARLKARGSRVVTVRLRPGDRDIAQSAAGDVAAALGALPGAAGISTGAARCIVALHPPLSSTWSADPDGSTGEEGIRRRTIALHELVTAVADDAPVCLLLDDVHWMDDVSRRMLTSVLQRLDAQRFLVVSSSRPRYPGIAAHTSVELMLHPLSLAQTGALIASVGTLPELPWAASFARQLQGTTGGSPLLTLETLHLLLERDLLRLDDSGWSAPNSVALSDTLRAGSALSARVASLGGAEHDALLALSLAGTALDEPFLASALDTGDAAVRVALAGLEQRGLALRTDDGWVIAHDAIGEAAVAPADAVRTSALQRRLGEAWLRPSDASAEALRRAASQFVAASEPALVRAAFIRWVCVVRRLGDDRDLRALVDEFLPSGVALNRAELVAAMPLSLRVPKRTRYAIGAVAMLALVGVAFTALRPDPAPPPDAVLTAVMPNERDAIRIEIDEQRFPARQPLEFHTLPSVAWHGVEADRARLSPNGRWWAFDPVFPDSGGQEIAVAEVASGMRRRVTFTRDDDASPSWSPDSRQLAYSSGGPHPKDHNKLMVADLETGERRQLTFGDESDLNPSWHPSGTYIGFIRRYWVDRPDDFCRVTVSATLIDCIPLTGYTGAVSQGWYDGQRVVVRAVRDGGAEHLLMVNVATREVNRLGDMTSVGAVMSGDGEWIACACAAPGSTAVRWYVFPTTRPDLARPVMYTLVDDRPFRLVWSSRHPMPEMVVAVAIDAPAVLYTTASAQLRAWGVDVAGQRSSGLPARWESMDTTVAVIDAITGMLTPRRAGVVTLRVDLGGWRHAEATVQIATPAAQTVLDARWDHGIDPRFVPGGDPRPRVVDLPGVGAALALNGDHSWTSGIHTREVYDASRGLGVETLVSARIDSMQWQNLTVSLLYFPNDSALNAWDGTHGGIPAPELSAARARCLFQMPRGEGPRALRSFALISADSVLVQSLPPVMRSGKPFRLHVQLLPDGSCGFAVDGRVLGWLPGPRLGERYRLVLHGYSAGTTIAAGPIQMWTGVKPGIDWRLIRSAPPSSGR